MNNPTPRGFDKINEYLKNPPKALRSCLICGKRSTVVGVFFPNGVPQATMYGVCDKHGPDCGDGALSAIEEKIAEIRVGAAKSGPCSGVWEVPSN